MLPDFVVWTAGIITAVVVAATLVYILGFVASMIVSLGYGLYEGVEHAAHRVHKPHWHLPSWPHLRETLKVAWQHSLAWPKHHLHLPSFRRTSR